MQKPKPLCKAAWDCKAIFFKNMNKTTIEKIASQAKDEIMFDLAFKQGKISNWQKNEEMLYQNKKKIPESRSSVQLGQMSQFVYTLLSKINNPLDFNFLKTKNAQIERVKLLNALKDYDKQKDNWEIKNLVGNKQLVVYGRAIYSYYADSIDGYKSHLEPVDVYDFLIDPSCGGIDIEEARHLGSYSVMLDKRQLKEGAKNGMYLKWAVPELLEGSGNADESLQIETNKRSRMSDQKTLGQKENGDPTKFKFWRWSTTYQEDGERYYLLIDNSGRCIRCELNSDLFPPSKDYPMGPWPYWTAAAFPDLTEFWTPSYCDYVRELFMAGDVSINQMLDNAEAINKPQRVVNISAIENLAELKYRRDGVIKTKGDFDINKVYQTINTPSINTPIQVFNILENISSRVSGVTDGAAGVADEGGKVGIYEGNQAAAADRFKLANLYLSFGRKRFARLYELGVRDNLTKKIAIDIVGPEGVEIKKIRRSDIFRKDDEFGISVDVSNQEILASNEEKKTKIDFLTGQVNNQNINQKKAFEIQASIAGFTKDEITELLDTSFYGNSELMGECERDIESLLDGEEIKPNQAANNAYKQKMVDYLNDHEEDISFEQFQKITIYIDSLNDIIMRNEARTFQNEQTQMMSQQAAIPGVLPQGQPQPLPNLNQ